MDLSEIPFDVPIILQSLYQRKNLQNPLGAKSARCVDDSRDVYEQLVLRRVRDDKVAIHCARNGRFLQVRASGECVFDAKAPGDWELFTMESDASCALFFVSCHTGNALQCDDKCVAKCANGNRQLWEKWRVLEPRSVGAAPTPQVQATPDRRELLVGKERQDFVLELVKCGKSPDEIDQIVTRLFDAPPAAASSSPSAFAVPVDKA
ncbi:Phosphatidate cytidylyltransferase [Phytophthora cinnamomi]|uniref:Phosphatidate cytidylyltransferase n=1 Tax=Phytophthora cinnamomi TaxID=4785 RepID=UPI00355A5F60|nr:Phosphatidate cytidylyltransferase [Phytophthora cinnamomi]